MTWGLLPSYTPAPAERSTSFRPGAAGASVCASPALGAGMTLQGDKDMLKRHYRVRSLDGSRTWASTIAHGTGDRPGAELDRGLCPDGRRGGRRDDRGGAGGRPGHAGRVPGHPRRLQRLPHAVEDRRRRPAGAGHEPDASGHPRRDGDAAGAAAVRRALDVGRRGDQHRLRRTVGGELRPEPDAGRGHRPRRLDAGDLRQRHAHRQALGPVATDPAADAVAEPGQDDRRGPRRRSSPTSRASRRWSTGPRTRCRRAAMAAGEGAVEPAAGP